MKNQDEVITIARDADLRVIEITTGSNGYPQGLGDYGVIDFDSYETAKEFAKEHKCEVVLFHQKNGWHLWENRGNRYEPLSADDYLRDLGDNYSSAMTIQDENNYFAEKLADLSQNFDGNLDNIKEAIKEYEKLISEIETADEDEVVITSGGRYIETIKEKMMAYSEDCDIWEIGVLVPTELDDNNDEDEDE
jgi:hypothetical protein